MTFVKLFNFIKFWKKPKSAKCALYPLFLHWGSFRFVCVSNLLKNYAFKSFYLLLV